MALPQVGLEAIIAGLPGFEAGARAITKAYDDIEKKGANVAKASNVLSSSISSLASPFTSIGQSVLNFGAIAGGTALLGVTALTAGIGALGAMALGEISKYERMSLSIQNLVAREISQGQVIEQQTQSRIALTAKETEELSKIPQKIQDEELSRRTLAAQIQEQRQRIIDLTASYGDNGLNVQTAKARLAEMENEYGKSGSAIDTLNGRMNELNSKNGSLVTTMQKVRVGQMSMTEAMELASPRAQDLIKWIQILAIQSPFNSEDIQNAFQTALAYGFTSEQAQRLTEAEVDFVAATGKSAQSADLIALALGQIQARGKLSAQELRQLSEQGVGVNKILDDMGYSLDDVTNGLVPVDKFIEATIKDMEVFKGAAKDQATTFAGLITSLGEIKTIALREFFTGTFKNIQPYLATFVDFLTKAALQTGSIKEMGNAIGEVVGKGLAKVAGWIQIISELGAGGGLSILNELFGPAIFPLWRELSDLVSQISLSFSGVGESLTGLMPSFSELSAIILPAITTALAFVNDHFEEFKGALLGIGGVLAVGTFAAITTGLLSLLTPINLIIAGAALLGAAWVGNWGGIQDIILTVIKDIRLLWAAFSSGDMEAVGQVGLFIANQLTTAWSNYIQPQLNIWGTQFMDWVSQVYPQIPTMLTSLVTSISGFLTQYWPTISATLLEWSSKFWDWTKDAALNVGLAMAGIATALLTWALSPEAQTSMSGLGSNLGKMIVDGIKLLFQGADGTSSILASLASGLVVGVAGIASTLIILGGELVAGIVSGILSSLGINLQPATFSELSTILTGIGNNIVTIASYVGTQIVQGIQNGWNMMVSTVTEAFENGVESWTNIITETQWIDIGKNIILGILEGIEKNTYLVLKSLKELAMEAVQDAMKEWGIGSPSTVFAKIGEEAITGLMVGIDTKSKEFKDKLSSLLDEAIGLTQGLVESGMAGGGIRQMVRNVFRSVMTNTSELGNLTGERLQGIVREQLKQFGYSVEYIEKVMEQLGYNYDQMAQQLNETHSSLMRELRLEAAGQSIGRAGQFVALGQAAAERLKARVETLKELVAAGGGEYLGEVYSAVEAQNLLNAALDQQVSTQKEINALAQQQADLQFLQQQVSILKMVQEAGLDASQIFGGITFGLHASLPDLIKATSNVVQAMIGQINQDLQISSPSKVMANVGKLMNVGLGKGLIDSINVPLSAVGKTLDGMINVATGQITGQSTSYTTNNNFDMKVSALSSPQAVTQQFQVMRAMI